MGKKLLSLFLLLFTFQSFGTEFEMIGSYLLEYSIFKIDVYQISYFKGKETEKLVLNYKVDVKKEHSIEGWKVGLKHKLKSQIYMQKAQWLFDHTFDVKEGDNLSIVKNDGMVKILINDKLMGETSDALIAELAFEPWLGNKPVDDKLKQALLGKKQK